MNTRTITTLVCVGFLLTQGACFDSQKTADMGEACDGSDGITQCRIGLICDHDGICQDPGNFTNGPKGSGEDCASSDECGYGLVCGLDRSCIRAGITQADKPCAVSEDCQFELVCSGLNVCGPPGRGSLGSDCLGAQDCSGELVCAGTRTCADPEDPDAVGVGGPGEACSDTGDCRFGMICHLDGTCQAVELWQGGDCAASEEAAQNESTPFKVYFEIPDLETPGEFYRLPFPNDIRLNDGRVSLSGHARPDTPLAQGVVGAYLNAIEAESDGFSTQAAVFVRFSKTPKYATIDLVSAEPNVYLVDITPASPGYGAGWPLSMYATSSRGKYICGNWLSLKPLDGYPLRHRTTYAVVVGSGIRSSDDEDLVRDEDFIRVMGLEAPADTAGAAAWNAYQPLRDYLDANGGSGQVMAAAVFTTMDPDALPAGFRDKLRACAGADCTLLPEATPQNVELVSEEIEYQLLSGTIEMPIFQVGQAPYFDSGGGITRDGAGSPIIQQAQAVSFHLSVPKDSPPAGGWPVVIYAHGTGGSSESFTSMGVAAELSRVEVDLGAGPNTVRFAVLSIDGVQHGTRRGGSELGPDVLFFNFLNPEAAKYNTLQGAVDNFQLVRMIEHLAAQPLGVTGVPDPVQLNASAIVYFGHSQGSLTGPLFLAHSPAPGSAVLSAAGGNLVRSLLTKTQPVDIAGATRMILADGAVDSLHPMLNLLQLYFDPIDGTNYGGALTRAPLQVGETDDDPPEPIFAGPKHLFMSFGRDDAFTTEGTMIALARSLAIPQVDVAELSCDCHDPECDQLDAAGLHEALCRVSGLSVQETPLRANAWWNGSAYTAGLKMYLPDGYDGHFVLFQHPQGPTDYARFIASTIADPAGTPSLLP